MEPQEYARRIQATASCLVGLDEKQMMILLFCAGERTLEGLVEALDLLEYDRKDV